MKLAIVIVHNKTNSENQAQISSILPLVVKNSQLITEDIYDSNGNVIGQQINESYYYIIKGLTIPHEVRFYQVVPYGVNHPLNFNELDSHNVIYGKGDEDKTGNHPRFFNWGLKRGTDYGADICIYLDNLPQFTATKARQALQKFTNDTEFVEATFGKLASLRLLKTVGQLKEDRNLTEAVSDLKTRVVQKGLKNG